MQDFFASMSFYQEESNLRLDLKVLVFPQHIKPIKFWNCNFVGRKDYKTAIYSCVLETSASQQKPILVQNCKVIY